MSALILYRIDPGKRMRRFYRLDVQENLFGEWCLIREWGRIGRSGQTRSLPFPTPEAAHTALDRQRVLKEKRGYGNGNSGPPSRHSTESDKTLHQIP